MLEPSSKDAIRLIGGDKASFLPALIFNLILSCDLCLDLLLRGLSDFGAAGGGEVTTGFGKVLDDVVAINTLLMSFDFDCVSGLSCERGLFVGSGVLFDMDLWCSYCGRWEKYKFRVEKPKVRRNTQNAENLASLPDPELVKFKVH